MINCALNVPSALNARPKGFIVEAETFCDNNQWDFLTLIFNNHVVCSVSGLSSWASPSTILLTVPERVINSVNRKSVRTFAHIINECWKIEPFWAYGYPLFAIQLIASMSFVKASAAHFNPYSVFSGIAFAVFDAIGFVYFFLKTSAGRRLTAHKARVGNFFFCATIATAKPVGRFISSWGLTYGGQSAKAITGKVDCFHTMLLRIHSMMGAWRSASDGLFGATLAMPIHSNIHRRLDA
jgi:hypothetical protein